MPNTSRLWRYQISSSDNSLVRNVLVRADTSANTLILASVTNSEPAALNANQTFNIVLQGRGGAKSKISYARTVTVVMTAAAAPLTVGSRAIIPVFRRDRFASYSVGQTGTYLGGACQCIGKSDGVPSASGAGF